MIPVILIGYLIFLAAWGVISLLALYQLSRFGYVGDASRRAIALYVLISTILILISFVAIIIAFG